MTMRPNLDNHDAAWAPGGRASDVPIDKGPSLHEDAGRAPPLSPNKPEIEIFLRDHVGSAIHVVSIKPDLPDGHADKINSRYFGDAAADAAAWVARENNQGCGCYWTVNITRDGLSKKPSKSDIVAARFAHADIDPPKGAAAMDKGSALASLLALEIVPSRVINSGNGLQPLWQLAYAPQDWAHVEDINYSIEKHLGADHCHNIDRLLRIPGTVNWPDAKKRARGRVPVIATLEYVGDDNAIYTPEELAKAFPKINRPKPKGEKISAADLGDIKLLTTDDLGITNLSPIWSLVNQPSGRDRSVDGVKVAGAMLDAKFSIEEIVGILLNPANAVSAHYLSHRKPKLALRAALRAIEFAGRPAEESEQEGEEGTATPDEDTAQEEADAVGDEQPAAACQDDARRAELKKIAIAKLKQMNTQYFVVREGSRMLVGFFEKYQGREGVVTMQRHEFCNMLAHIKFPVDSDPKSPELKEKHVNVAVWWWTHSRRLQYEGLALDPKAKNADGSIRTVVDGNRLNIWRGFGVKPTKGDCSLFMDHLLFVAGGDEERATYILHWLAWAIQNPGRRAEVALVFKGPKGCGKGTIGNTMQRLFGTHGMQISSADQISGRFNAHLRGMMLLFADEAYWPGDKAAEGNFKRLISEPTLSIEQKGRDVIEAPNVLHMIMASNEEWVVPATEGERRYFVVDVPGDHAREQKYFDPLYEQLENGGYEALLHDLLALDIGDFHPRKMPEDKNALLSQQAASLQPLDSWWVELLQTGTLAGCDPRHPERAVSNKFEETITVGMHDRLVKRDGLYDQARSIEPRLRSYTSEHQLGKYLTDRGCDNTKKVLRRRGWTFPPLSECRKEWEKDYPGWEWRNPNLNSWQCEGTDDDEE